MTTEPKNCASPEVRLLTAPQNPRVTQADKQAAEAFWMVHGPFAWGTVATLYEAFARHREAAEAASKAREAALVEALKKVAPLLDYLPHPHCVEAIDAVRAALTPEEPDA